MPVSTASLGGGGGDAERRGGGGGGGVAGCKGGRPARDEPGRLEPSVSLASSWRSGSGWVGALVGLRGFLLLPRELRELVLLRGGGGNEGLLTGFAPEDPALPPAGEPWEAELLDQIEARVSLASWSSGRAWLGALLGLRGFLALPPSAGKLKLRGRVGFGLRRAGGGSEGFLALPRASLLRVELPRGGGGNGGFLALPSELWEIGLGGGGGSAIFRPQEHLGGMLAVAQECRSERPGRRRTGKLAMEGKPDSYPRPDKVACAASNRDPNPTVTLTLHAIALTHKLLTGHTHPSSSRLARPPRPLRPPRPTPPPTHPGRGAPLVT